MSNSSIPSDATIKSVTVTIKSNSQVKIATTVNNQSLGSQVTTTSASGTNKDYKFSGTRVGNDIVMTFSGGNTYAVIVTKIVVTYEEANAAVAPTFSPEGGLVTAGTNVTVSTTTEGATIYYTTDGTDPTSASTEYTDAIAINETQTIKAIAVKDGKPDSEVSSATYTVTEKVAAPTFSPAAGTYTSAQNVTISSATGEATIYYTTDGTDPTTESTAYTGAIAISETTTIKAIAVKDDMINSDVAEADYTIIIPSISSSEVNINYSATSGSIAYTLTNPVDGGVLTAAITAGNDGNWLTLGTVGSEAIAFTCLANYDENDRTATVTLTYTYDTGKTVTTDVTVKQGKFVVDYAALPFEYDGNGTGTLPVGFTDYGLGTYNSSPKMQFNNSDDWAILKINEEPGKLTFDIKGNNFSGGTFKVQTSVDGVTYTDLKTYTSLGSTQSEEFDNLNPYIRYFKWIYTNKSSGNVALGNIKVAKPTNEAKILLGTTSVEATSAETEGTINVTYKNITYVIAEVKFYEADGTTAATYDHSWILTNFDSSNNVEYIIEANTGDARTAYMKVYALDDEVNDVYSELITITQSKYVDTSVTFDWVATNLADLASDDEFVIVGNNAYALSNDKGTSSAPIPVAVTVSDGKLSAAPEDNIIWNVSGNATNGYTFYPNGDATKWLYCNTTATSSSNENMRVGTGDRKLFELNSSNYLITKDTYTTRYLSIYNTQDWRSYVNTSNNPAALSFYKKSAVSVSVKFAASGYASYCSPYALDLTPTDDYAAWIVTATSGEEVTFSKIEGAVPAGTPFILYGKEMGGQTVSLSVAAGETTAVTGNMLRGTLTATDVTTEMEIDGNNYTLFGLSGGSFVKIEDGTIPARKAYLPVLTSSLTGDAPLRIVFNDDVVTGISGIQDVTSDNVFYNMQGMRVTNPTRGLYIVNGKNVLVK